MCKGQEYIKVINSAWLIVFNKIREVGLFLHPPPPFFLSLADARIW